MSRPRIPVWRKDQKLTRLSDPSEREIQAACDELMVLDSWRVIVTDPPHLRGLGVMEPGMCDRLYVRYREPFNEKGWPSPQIVTGLKAGAEVLWIEWKARKGRIAAKQKEWQVREKLRGALIWCSQKDFTPTVQGYWAHYCASGLLRKKITLEGKTK